MDLSKSGDTYVLECHCGRYNLSFCDHGTQLTGTVRCPMCGAAAEWRELLAAGSAPRPNARSQIERDPV